MLKGIGVDLVSIERIGRVYQRYQDKFLQRVFAAAEIREITKLPLSPASLAARFAAKEAVLKAIGCGIGPAGLSEVEIIRKQRQKPTVKLHGETQRLAAERGISGIELSLTHEPPFACAVAAAF
jgi:holo-[acyl-carrier protein] synthase